MGPEDQAFAVNQKAAAAANIRTWLVDLGEAEVVRRISVKIEQGTWLDGSLYLQAKLTELLKEQLPQLIPMAIQRMEDDANVARREMAQLGPEEPDARERTPKGKNQTAPASR